MKKIILKILPYATAIISGWIFYFLANINTKFYDLCINISATFFTIFLVYLFYETIKKFSHKKLSEEIFGYTKMEINLSLLSIFTQLKKLVFQIETSEREKADLIFIDENKLKEILSNNKYLGFQIFKTWEYNTDILNDILKNPFILSKMEDEQIISIIKVINGLKNIEATQKIQGLYKKIGAIKNKYKIQHGEDINPENKKFPNRYLLLEYIDQEKFIVRDFGDIPKYNIEECLNQYVIDEELIQLYAKNIYYLLKSVDDCLRVNGLKFQKSK